MIAHLSGTVLHKDIKYVILQAGGVGYKVFATERDLEMLRLGEHAGMWIHTAVREDAIDLFGFLLRDSKEMFDFLLTVSGIGPKTALGVLNAAGHDKIRDAVVMEEISYLTSISGIGKKMAEKIVIELKGKLGAIILINQIDPTTGKPMTTSGGAFGSSQSDIDTIEALKSLGYTHREAKDALERLDAEVRKQDTGEKIKALLKVLS